MNAGILLIIIYLSARLFFLPLNQIMGVIKPRPTTLILRLSWSLWSVFLLANFLQIALLLLTHFVIVCGEFYIHIKRPDFVRFGYWTQSVIILGILPPLINLAAEYTGPPSNNALFILKWWPGMEKVLNNQSILFIMAGYIWTLKEGTVIIRRLLNKISAFPVSAANLRDNQEYERGKLIGNLERTFFFFLILLNQITAVTIIIALKSLARFKELNNKSFAEYFLIGSLLSLLIAAIPAILIRLLIIS